MAYTTDFATRKQSLKESVNSLRTLTEELAKQATGITLYNPSDRVIVGRLSGQTLGSYGASVPQVYRIPYEGMVPNPHTGNREPSDGTLVVHDDVRQDPEALRNWRDNGSRKDQIPGKTKQFHSAAEVAAHLVRQNEHLGLCYLTGSPEERERQKYAARMKFIEVRKAEAEARVVLAHRKAADAKALGMNYQFSSDEVKAEQFLIESQQDEGQNRHVCRFRCGFWHFDEAKVDQHIEMRHKDDLAGEIAAVRAAEVADEQDEKRGRRRSA